MIVVNPNAQDLHAGFFAEAKCLWEANLISDNLLDLAALRLMDFAGSTSGLDLEARDFSAQAEMLASRIGLCSGHLRTDIWHAFGHRSSDICFQAAIAWGYFTSTS